MHHDTCSAIDKQMACSTLPSIAVTGIEGWGRSHRRKDMLQRCPPLLSTAVIDVAKSLRPIDATAITVTISDASANKIWPLARPLEEGRTGDMVSRQTSQKLHAH